MYELMLIAKGTDGADNLVSKLEKHFKELSLEGVKLEKLGKKTLAYPIGKQSEAEYLLCHFETDGATINQLSGRLRLEQELVLRYLITTYDPSKALKSAPAPAAKAEEPTEKPKPKVTVTTKVREKAEEEPKKKEARASKAKKK